MSALSRFENIKIRLMYNKREGEKGRVFCGPPITLQLWICFADWLVMMLTVCVFQRLASDDVDCVCASKTG